MINTLCPEADDFLELIKNGIHGSLGDHTIFKKAINHFSAYVSDDMEDCLQYANQHGISVWDFYQSDRLEWSSQLNDLWITYVIAQANILKQ
jgi:hypothetical protein